MTDQRNRAIDGFLMPLLVVVLTPLLTLVGSRLVAGDWLAWTREIPGWGYAVLVALFLAWFIAGPLRSRVRSLRSKNLPSQPMVFGIPIHGYEDIGTMNYQGVKWRVRVAAAGPSGIRLQVPHSVDVASQPLCPDCDTALEETETLFGRFRWACIACDFVHKNKMSYHNEVVRAQKIADAWWEKEKAKTGS